MKKVMSKKLLVLCFTAIAICMAPLMASAATERLIVRDDNDEITFKVCDTGVAVGTQFSMGTLTPQAPFHVNLPSAVDNMQHPVGTTLYSVSTGAVLSSQDNSAALDLTVAEEQGIAGYRGAIRGVRARGTLENPTAADAGDGIVSLLAGVYDGTAVLNTGEMKFTVDGPVSSGVAPVRIVFNTRTGGTGVWTEKLTIKNDGKIGIGEPNPTSILQIAGVPVYANNAEATAAGLTAGAVYRTATGLLMIAY